MDFNRHQESAREQQREREQQQTQHQQRQAEAARPQSSAEMQRQLEVQRQQAIQQTRQQGRDQSKVDSQKQADALSDQQKKRQAQERNRNEALRRQPRDNGVANKPQPVASKNMAVPPGPQSPTPALKPGAALQQAGMDAQVAEASRAGVKQVLAEKSENTPVKDAHKAAEKPVTTKEAAQLLDVAGRLGINSHNLLQKEGEVTAPPTKQEISKALETAEKIGVRPEVTQRLRQAEREAKPEPERAPKAPEQERDMGR